MALLKMEYYFDIDSGNKNITIIKGPLHVLSLPFVQFVSFENTSLLRIFLKFCENGLTEVDQKRDFLHYATLRTI